MIIDHTDLAVSDYEKRRQFFSRALAPLGIERVVRVAGWQVFEGWGKRGSGWVRMPLR
jgi:catechol 2,3-dioxygenase-like lactoylglutathione lyase family enzyme